MATAPNQAQIAPGEEAGHTDFNTPYVGADPSNHVGVSTLMQEFELGAVYGYYRQAYDPHIG